MSTKPETRGAQVLDEDYPGWEKKVNVETLNIDDLYNCVLGQLYYRYSAGVEALSGYDFYSDEAWQWAVDHGFDSGSTNRWREEIRNRLDVLHGVGIV